MCDDDVTKNIVARYCTLEEGKNIEEEPLPWVTQWGEKQNVAIIQRHYVKQEIEQDFDKHLDAKNAWLSQKKVQLWCILSVTMSPLYFQLFLNSLLFSVCCCPYHVRAMCFC